jgi:uncharacterized protein (TIGR03437 family)
MYGSGTSVVSRFSFKVGRNDAPTAVAVDASGNLWIVGATVSGIIYNPLSLGFIAELDSSGSSVLFASTFGGLAAGTTSINAIAFDPSGNLYLGGSTTQLDFPVTPGAFIPQFGAAPAPPCIGNCVFTPQYGFIAKLSPSKQPFFPFTLAYSTLLGGSQTPGCPSCQLTPASTAVSALLVDAKGVVTAAGTTDASDFPVTPGAYQTQCKCQNYEVNAFIARLNAQGTGLVWSTLLGGGGAGLGGIAVDSNGNVVVDGATGPGFPVTSGAIQSQFTEPGSVINGFVAKLDSTGANLLFSTYYGATGRLTPPRLDAQGDIWISGQLFDQSGLVLHPNSLVLGDVVIAELAPDGSSVLFSELLPNGVAGQDLVVNPGGSLTVIGPGPSNGYGIVLALPGANIPGLVSILGVADSAVNAVTNAVAPGEYISIYGTGLGPAVGVGMQIDPSGRVANSLGGTRVSFNGVPAPLIYAAENQINVLVPYEIAGSAQANMTITTGAGTSQTLALQVVPAQPNIFAILNSDGSVNSKSNRASPGDTVSILVSGAGVLNPALPDGTIAASPAPATALAVQVNLTYIYLSFIPFANQSFKLTVTPTYAGGIPGTVIDMLRVDVTLPSPSLGEQYTSSPAVVVQVGSSKSPPFQLYN